MLSDSEMIRRKTEISFSFSSIRVNSDNPEEADVFQQSQLILQNDQVVPAEVQY